MLLALIEIVGPTGTLAGAVPARIAPAWTVLALMLATVVVVMAIVVVWYGAWRWLGSTSAPLAPVSTLPVVAPAPRIELGDQVQRLLAHIERANTSFEAAIAAHAQAGDCLDSAEYQLRCLRDELKVMTAGRARAASAIPAAPLPMPAPTLPASLLAA